MNSIIMNSTFSTEKFLSSLKSNKFVLGNIPIGYVKGLPILNIKNGNLCMVVPFLKYKITGEVDNTFVYPIHYAITFSIPEGTIVGFEDLAFNESFNNVKFTEPIGTFRHDAVKSMDKEGFQALKSSLYEEYDKIVSFLTLGTQYTHEDEIRFISLINTILEPSLHPFYMALDKNFATKYLK